MHLSRAAVLLGLFFGTVIPAASQETPTDSSRLATARRLFDEATSEYSRGDPASRLKARSLLWTAMAEAERLQNPRVIGIVAGFLARTYHVEGPTDSAIVLYRISRKNLEAASDSQNLRETLWQLAFLFDDQGPRDSAYYYTREVLIRTPAGDPLYGPVLLQLGQMFVSDARADSARLYLTRAVQIASSVGDNERLAHAFLNIGFLHEDLGQLDSASHYYARADSLTSDPRHPLQKVQPLRALARIDAALARYREAVIKYDSALGLAEDYGNLVMEGDLLLERGQVYSEQGANVLAVESFREALVRYQAFGFRPRVTTGLRNLAGALLSVDSLEEARRLLDEIAAVPDLEGLSRAYLLNSYGVLSAREGRDSEARKYFEEALHIADSFADLSLGNAVRLNLGSLNEHMAPDSAERYLHQALDLARSVSPRDQFYAFANLASLHYSRGGPENLMRALLLYDSAFVVRARDISNNRRRPGSISPDVATFFARWALAWLNDDHIYPPREKAVGAWGIVERARARELLELMRIRGGVNESASDTSVGGYPGALVDSTLHEMGNRGFTVMNYLVTTDTLVIWLSLRSGDVLVERQPVSQRELETLIKAVRERIGGHRVRDQVDLLEKLGALLLPPQIRRRLPSSGELIILPDGVLNLVPFAAIPIDDRGTPLGASYALRYAPSLETLSVAESRASILATQNQDRRPFHNALVVGNPEIPDSLARNGFDPIPGSESEADSVARRLAVTALKGKAATEAAVRARMSSADLIHLATHGLSQTAEPLARTSFIVLAADPVAGFDGTLTVGEILDDPGANVRAELVVLSACETALGNWVNGDGTAGFQRAFLARGARSVLVSLWRIPDEATNPLMQLFYRYWLEDQLSKAEALRRAQSEIRQAPGFESPYFWAGFQLFGAR